MTTSPQTILIDTCVLLEDPNVIARIRHRGGIPFLTSTVLEEIDFNKQGSEVINKNARSIFRELNKEPTTKLANLPNGRDLNGDDLCTRFTYENGPVFLINRDSFKSRTNNDGKIIELAKDYGMLLLTRDNGMKVRADAMGVTAVLWKGPQQSSEKNHKSQSPAGSTSRKSSPNLQPFELLSSPTTEEDKPTAVTHTPKQGDLVILGSGQNTCLGPAISAGGEGTIYQLANSNLVCKVYHSDRLTLLRRKKIELMVSRKIQRPGICWPIDIMMNDRAEFVGYVMPRASGRTVQSSMFVKPLLEKTFPGWGRKDLVNLCLAFLEHIRFLHGLNIIVGDINPLNLLVTEDSTNIWMVDTDSFQIENFPCPVGTVNFTAPEIQGRKYPEFLRSKEHELFAVATMLFMLLHPGKPPYSQQGGGSPSDNIKAMDFPYRFRKDDDEYGGKNAPHGPWQLIWSNLPYVVKEGFHHTFRENKRLSVDNWLRVMRKYQQMLTRNQTSAELFPSSVRILDPVDVPCGKCGSVHTASQQWVDKMNQQGKQSWCPECVSRAKLERLARDSERDASQAVQQNAGKKSASTVNQRQQTSWGPGSIKSGQQRSSQTRPPHHQPSQQNTAQNYSYSSYSRNATTGNSGGLISALFKLLFK